MRNDKFTVKKHSGIVTLPAKVGNGTVTTPKHSDTTYYQVAAHGDFVQEKN